MIVSLRMQDAVDDEVREVLAEGLALLARLAPDDRHAQHDVGAHDRRVLVVERQHVGRVVLAPELAVQPARLGRADEAQRQFGVAFERGPDPAHERASRRQAVEPALPLDRQRQRHQAASCLAGFAARAGRLGSATPVRSSAAS